jgi:hypothetical protein
MPRRPTDTAPVRAARRRLRAAAARVFPQQDDAYRCWLAATFPHVRWKDSGRPSTLDLSLHQLEEGLGVLNRVGPTDAPRSATHGSRRRTGYNAKQPWRGRYHGAGRRGDGGSRLTQHQADEIARLEDELGWTARGPKTLGAFLKRQTGALTLPSALTRKQAADVVTGMRRLIEHNRSRDAA